MTYNESSKGDAWLTTEVFASNEGLSRRSATRILAAAARGAPWRGRRLEVRIQRGRGGKAGVRFEVRQEVQSDRVDEAEALAVTARDQELRVAQRFAAVSAAAAFPIGSTERAAALSTSARRLGRDKRTLRRWLERYEVHGLAGLGNKRPSNSGRRRVFVSRDFDLAVRRAGASVEVLEEVGAEVDDVLRGLWASRAERSGWREIRRLAEHRLKDICGQHRFQVAATALRLSRRRVEAFAHFRVVNRRRNDRKAFDDAKPRIRRVWTALAPMDRIVADVKHLDIIVQRDDGSLAWPKIVAFLDAGTNRIFVRPFLLGRGEAIRQEHVIEAFLAMVADPDWGFPGGLYLDNGLEFSALTKIQAALNALNEPGVRTVIFARPYNASAKPIESMFARLDRYVFSLLPGYAGPDRMAQKTQTVGKAPEPYPHGWDQFCATIRDLIEVQNHRPIGGAWQDRAPVEWFEAKRNAGWKAATVDPVALDAAFCSHDSRRIDRGVLKIKGQRFYHPTIAALPGRTVVDVALPWRRDAWPLARIPGHGWVRLRPDLPYPADWLEGAREADRRQAAQRRYVGDLSRQAPKIDPVALKIESHPPRPEPRGLPGPASVDLGTAANQLAGALTLPPPPASAAELRRKREMAITEKLEERFGRADD